jgi:hypothetical protein
MVIIPLSHGFLLTFAYSNRTKDAAILSGVAADLLCAGSFDRQLEITSVLYVVYCYTPGTPKRDLFSCFLNSE